MITTLFDFIYKAETFLLQKIPVAEPLNRLAIASIIALAGILSVILIGSLIDQIKKFEYRSLANASSDNLAKLIVFRLTFPGTVIHEFSHAMFAFLTGAKVTKIQCFSIKKNTLGYVTYQTRGSKLQQMVQHGLSACAPVISGLILAPMFLSLMFTAEPIMIKILAGYMTISVVNHMNMSWLDVKQYVKGVPIIFLIIFTVSYISLLTIHI